MKEEGLSEETQKAARYPHITRRGLDKGWEGRVVILKV